MPINFASEQLCDYIMAISHIASIRGSARMAAQQQRTATAAAVAAAEAEATPALVDTMITQDSQSNGDDKESGGNRMMDQVEPGMERLSLSSDRPSRSDSHQHIPAPAPLAVWTSLADMESDLDSDLHQVEVIKKLESKWSALTNNFDTVVAYLNEQSNQVGGATFVRHNHRILVPCF